MSKISMGFIGYGNMAQAIAKGLVKEKVISPENIYACAKHYDKLVENTQKLGINPCEDVEDVVRKADMIVIAVKPYQIEEVVGPLGNALIGKIVVSVAAGYTFDKYEKILPEGVHHISTNPNTPIEVGAGIIACEEHHNLSEDELRFFYQVFEPIALIEMVETSKLSIAGTICGCTPAYTAMYMEALADAAVKHGLPRQSAYRMVAQMIYGTGKLYLETETHPGIMKDKVCSPNGTTIKGVASLERDGFRGAVISAIDAAENKNEY